MRRQYLGHCAGAAVAPKGATLTAHTSVNVPPFRVLQLRHGMYRQVLAPRAEPPGCVGEAPLLLAIHAVIVVNKGPTSCHACLTGVTNHRLLPAGATVYDPSGGWNVVLSMRRHCEASRALRRHSLAVTSEACPWEPIEGQHKIVQVWR
jgi:hypothetical protein